MKGFLVLADTDALRRGRQYSAAVLLKFGRYLRNLWQLMVRPWNEEFHTFPVAKGQKVFLIGSIAC